jgi:predicted lipid-binding transport protein (Tim44 family)
MQKCADAQPVPGYLGVSTQRRLPTYERRQEFTPEEQALIDKNRRNVIPKIYKSRADSPAVDLASPVWSAVGGAIPGAVGGALAGYMATLGDNKGGLIGLLIGAGILGTISGLRRNAQNKDIIENMRRIPPDGTRRDMMSDPLYEPPAPVLSARPRSLAMNMASQQLAQGGYPYYRGGYPQFRGRF